MLEVWAHESFKDYNFNYTSLPFYLPIFLSSFLNFSFPRRSRMTHPPLLSLPPHSFALTYHSSSYFLTHSLVHSLPSSFLLSCPPCLPPSLLSPPSSTALTTPSHLPLLVTYWISFFTLPPFLPSPSFLSCFTNNSSSFCYISVNTPPNLSFLSLAPSLPSPLIPFSPLALSLGLHTNSLLVTDHSNFKDSNYISYLLNRSQATGTARKWAACRWRSTQQR